MGLQLPGGESGLGVEECGPFSLVRSAASPRLGCPLVWRAILRGLGGLRARATALWGSLKLLQPLGLEGRPLGWTPTGRAQGSCPDSWASFLAPGGEASQLHPLG